MTAPVIRQFAGTIPDKGQAQTSFDTNVDGWLDWTTLQFAPDLVAFGTWADGIRAALITGNLPSLAGRALDAVRVNAAGNGVEFADVTAAGWALLDDVNVAAQRATLGLGSLESGSDSTLEIGRFGSGDRSSFVDLHAHGAPNANDFSARLIRSPGVNGNLDIHNTGNGGVNINTGSGILSLNGANVGITGSAPIFACRAWVNFNGQGTVAIRASGNVSSITDNGTGDYTVNFATAMQDGGYALSGSVENTVNHPVRAVSSNNQLAGSARISTGLTGATTVVGRFDDCAQVCIMIVR